MIMGCKCCKSNGNGHFDDERDLNSSTTEEIANQVIINDPVNNIPNNKEMSPSQILHYAHRFIWQGNFSSPVEERLKANAQVLNVGCGEGEWVVDNASRYKFSNFSGCDASYFQYNASDSNYLLLSANILDRLPFNKDAFDFVYLSFGSFTENEWQEKVVKELVRVCKPDGWIEIMDCENKFYKEKEKEKEREGERASKRLEKACELTKYIYIYIYFFFFSNFRVKFVKISYTFIFFNTAFYSNQTDYILNPNK
jgi:SAM-dependent methyltransferase